MEVFRFTDDGLKIHSHHSKTQTLSELHRIGEKYLSDVYDSKKFTTDMDGVIVHDDSAIIASRIVAGPEAQQLYARYADLNIKAVAEGQTSYCWYAPTLFVGQLLKGLSTQINTTIGRNMRLVPGAEDYICRLIDGLEYEITAVTAGHQEAAEQVAWRAGIEETVGTKLKITGGVYDSSVERFIGGLHKLKHVKGLIDSNGTHIGDSWSDVETLGAITNSIAFNPGCMPSLRNAKISVIGISNMGLLPLLDYKGAYDSGIEEYELPIRMIIMESDRHQDKAEQLLKESKTIKKQTIPKILDEETTAEEMEETIKKELKRQKIDSQTKTRTFMPPEEFDAYAKEAYLKLN
ncbi:hypothetical protein KY345_05085 [Candidatus Woesearchaeota archaeon]|nr:hypothetical protein [Candidatus Woesearchaeota archaeon]